MRYLIERGDRFAKGWLEMAYNRKGLLLAGKVPSFASMPALLPVMPAPFVAQATIQDRLYYRLTSLWNTSNLWGWNNHSFSILHRAGQSPN